MSNLQNTVRRLIIILLRLFFLLIIKASIWSPYGKNLAEPRYEKKNEQFAKYCHTPLNLRFYLIFWCFSSYLHFGAFTVTCSLNPITAQNMGNLQNTATGLLFAVFRWSICAYHVSNFLEFLLWNFYLTKLRLIRWPVWKILSHASESSFSATPIALTFRTTCWSSYRDIVT